MGERGSPPGRGSRPGYEIELDQRQAAVDYLLELARRRQPGLVAGCDIPPEQRPAMWHYRRSPFLATPGDVPVCILAPRSLPSDALARNVAVVANQAANFRVVHDPSEIV